MRWLAMAMLAPALFAQDPIQDQIRSAASRSVALLQKASTGFYKAQDCFSCHHSGLPARALELAREHGVPVDEAAARATLVRSLSHSPDLSSIDKIVQSNLIIDPSMSEASALLAAHGAGLKPNLTTAIQARLIAGEQRADGHWMTIDERPPQAHSAFTATALSLRAIDLYLPEELRKDVPAIQQRARKWLLQATPETTEDFTFRLTGLVWSGASESERAAAVKDLRGLQRPNGGWSQLKNMQADAYATGEVLVALQQSGGVQVTDPAWRKGLQYLLSTQEADGSWRVRTRMVSPAQVSPPYFETGFPYGHDQFISSAATSYAAMALMLTLPKAARPAMPLDLSELQPKGEKPWMRTALFGSAADLKAALDKGLDLHSQTEGGTNLLMMAAPDESKMQLLLDRGIDVNAKAKSGYAALMLACLYRGSGDAVKLLLSKGAMAAPGSGVMFNASPLFLATYAGDREVVAALHEKGADPNRRMLLLGAFPASSLVSAIAFNDVDVIKELIADGADLKEKDPDGLSLLHMAVLTNHAEAAQALIDAGVSLNEVDKHGYTPLLYASTVDFGNDRMVNLLLKAGADPKVKAKSGETALSQARRYQYPLVLAALEKAGVRD